LAEPEQLVPWFEVMETTSERVSRLSRDHVREIASPWYLGSTRKFSEMDMFTYQSAVLCGYLYHAGGSQRDALMRYIADTHTGKVAVGTGATEKYLGIGAKELGEKARKWAQRVVDGEIQPEGTLRVLGAKGR
jgi:hypothetical protein